MRKFFTWFLIILFVVGGGWFYWRFYYVFGEGAKSGELNYVVKKGYVFKTWEGRLIQEGFKTPTPGAMQSNEFEFSVTEDSIAIILERCSGKFVELRYKEYLHSLPWRGMSNFVVTEVLTVDGSVNHKTLPY